MITTIFSLIILFYSIILHEIAHGYAAYRNGDQTAFNMGRLTLNPLKHIDFLGSIIVPFFSYFVFGFPFGWAKPVPYNPNNIKDKKYGELEVSSAGILINFFIAFISIIIFYLLKSSFLMSDNIKEILEFTASVNLFLALFNLLPFPPADGFSVFSEIVGFSKSFFIKFKNIFRKKKEYEASFVNHESKLRNKMFKIKSFFANPFMMIIVIIIAVNVFSLIIPYILSFINFCFSF